MTMRRARPHDDRAVASYLRHLQIRPHPEQGKVLAYVSQGRWVADCRDCEGAEMVIESKPMICGSCGAVRQVAWPDEGSELEAVLERRHPRNQNWRPGETVSDLDADNERYL